MGTERLPTRANGQTIDSSWFNIIKKYFMGNIVPYNSTGVPETLSGNIGSSAYRWKNAFITSGHFYIGQIKHKYDYNGLVTIEQGWMLCDGRVINQTNYDAEHGAGSWATYIGTSVLNGRYLPNLNDIYLVGGASTTQDGTLPISTEGNPAHSTNLNHDHGGSVTTSTATNVSYQAAESFPAGTENNYNDHNHYATLDLATIAVTVRPSTLVCKAYMRIF